MTQLDEKTSRLLSALIVKTDTDKVVWRKSISGNFYRAPFGNEDVIVRKRPRYPEKNDYVYSLSIQDENGQSTVIMRQAPGESNHNLLKQMFDVAKQSAERRIENSVEKILQELESR